MSRLYVRSLCLFHVFSKETAPNMLEECDLLSENTSKSQFLQCTEDITHCTGQLSRYTYARDDEKNMCEPLLIPLFCDWAIPFYSLS